MAQTGQVAEMIRRASPEISTELVSVSTRGDRHAGPLTEVGGKGLFTKELEDALREGRVDLAVHSAKDLPAEMGEEFTIAAAWPREDPRDALACRCGGLTDLPKGATVGTGSLRRRAQLLAIREDLNVVPIRGNVETRLKKAVGDSPELDAVVLAMAGLNRSGLAEKFGRCICPLDCELVIPAAGQGILALQAMAAREDVAQVLSELEDADSRAALDSERAVLRGLGAGCQSCLAIHISRAGDRWYGRAMVAKCDGSGMIGVSSEGDTAASAGQEMLSMLLADGAERLLAQ